MDRPIRVLIVDDSAVVRRTLADLLSSEPGLEVMAPAADPVVAGKRMADERPDVIILDIEMPRMDGLTFLEQLMARDPLPVLICSSAATQGSRTAFRALELGAVGLLEKPKLGTKRFLEESRVRIVDSVRSAARSRVGAGPSRKRPAPRITAAKGADQGRIILAGASMGGVQAVGRLLMDLPGDCPPLAVVQHMPPFFARDFALRLDATCHIRVRLAEHGDRMEPGLALIGPGDRHLTVRPDGPGFRVEVRDGPLVSRHRPSVNVFFRSAAKYAGARAIGLIMTGMGDDGAKGMRDMHLAGAYCLAQDEASSVVWGMPSEAIALGAVDKVVGLDRLAHEAVLAARR